MRIQLDIREAFPSASHEALAGAVHSWPAEAQWAGDVLLRLLSQGKVRFQAGGDQQVFDIASGTRQGCVSGPALFRDLFEDVLADYVRARNAPPRTPGALLACHWTQVDPEMPVGLLEQWNDQDPTGGELVTFADDTEVFLPVQGTPDAIVSACEAEVQWFSERLCHVGVGTECGQDCMRPAVARPRYRRRNPCSS